MRSLHELMRGMRAKLGERGDLNPGRDKKTELDLCSRVFSLAMNTLLATSRAGRAHDYNMADPSKFLSDGARLLRRPEGSAGAVAYALETAGYIIIDGAADCAAVNGSSGTSSARWRRRVPAARGATSRARGATPSAGSTTTTLIATARPPSPRPSGASRASPRPQRRG